jgi:hypothetical protein
VAIFPDGASLRRRLEHPLHREETRRLLGALQHWPRLAFVDCSPGGDQLAALFAANDLRLEVVALPQLPDWLGAVDKPAVPAATAEDGPPAALRQWAAVVALGGGEGRRGDGADLARRARSAGQRPGESTRSSPRRPSPKTAAGGSTGCCAASRATGKRCAYTVWRGRH